MQEMIGLPSLDSYALYGGHEYLKAHSDMSVTELDELWFQKKSVKLRSGFYAQAYEAHGEKFILINGFHPAQLAHFTEPDHHILLILVHSNTDWRVLRNDLIGATFPEKAVPDSIRGTFYADPALYGFESVTIANNCVHLSAGPYEGAFEIMNFFGRLLDLDPAKQTPTMFKVLMQKGLTLDQAIKCLDNPAVSVEGKQTDLFGATEDFNTEAAADLWLKQA